MSHDLDAFLKQHREVSRRYFFQLALGGALAGSLWPRQILALDKPDELSEKLARFATFLTPTERFDDVSRGTPLPHALPPEKKTEVGLTQETWQLEVIPDPDHPVKLRKPLRKSDGTEFTFAALMKLAETGAVRFPKLMTCLNIGCPLGMGIWEGVPLRDVLWLTQPRDDVRRVIYYGYHNDQPDQMFKSSLPIGRVLEDLHGLPPIILCYKLNGQWLDSVRGGPVRVVVPEAYGFKSIKWLSHVLLTSLPHANDTYADQGNDVDSPLKTFAATLQVPRAAKAGESLPISGYAQVGVGGLSKVQVWIEPADAPAPEDDPYFTRAPWRDMDILPPPKDWGGGLPDGTIPLPTLGFDAAGQPTSWPLPLSAAHWAGVHPGLPAGKYTLRSRTIDARGHAQPMPRPFRKSGHAMIEQVALTIE